MRDRVTEFIEWFQNNTVAENHKIMDHMKAKYGVGYFQGLSPLQQDEVLEHIKGVSQNGEV